MTTIDPCVCGGCCCCAHQQQAELACGGFALSSCGLSVKRVTAVSAMPSSVATAETSASSTAPRRPLVVDWQLHHVSHGSPLVFGYVYECTGPKVLPSAMLLDGVLVTTDGKQYDLLHHDYNFRTATIAASPGFATVDEVTPPVSKSLRRGRRNVPACSPHLRSSTDNRKMAAAVDGCTVCGRCMHAGQAGPCSFAPACCAAAATTASGVVAAVCSSGIRTDCRVRDSKHIECLSATVNCPSQPCLSSTPTTVYCKSLQPLPPVIGTSTTTAAASERPSPLLRPPTPFDDVGPTDLHMAVEADLRRRAYGATALSRQHLTGLTTQTLNTPAVAANCNGKADVSLLATWGVNPTASRRITEPIQDETVAESSQQSNVSVASLLPPIPHCMALPTSNAHLSSTAVQAAAVRTTVYPCSAPDGSTSTTAAVRATAVARTAAAPRHTDRSSSNGVTTTSVFTVAATSGRVLRSSNRHRDTSNRCTDTSASTSGQTLRSTAGHFDLSCTSTSTSTNASELLTFNWFSSHDGGSSAAPSSARRRMHADLESVASDHPPHSGKRPRLTVTEAAPEPSKHRYRSRKRYCSSHIQVSSRAATGQSEVVLSVPAQPTRTMGSRRTEPRLASALEHSHRVLDRRKVRPRERDACSSSSSSNSDDIARSVSSRYSRCTDGNRGSRRAALQRRSRLPSPLPRDGGADRLTSATRGSGGRAAPRKGTALGSHDAATHVKGRCRASEDRISSGDVPSAADSNAVRGPLRSDGAAVESYVPSSIDSGVCLPSGNSRLRSSGSKSRNVARVDGRPYSTNRALGPPDAAIPSASSSRMPCRRSLQRSPSAAVTRASNRNKCVKTDPARQMKLRVLRIRKVTSKTIL